MKNSLNSNSSRSHGFTLVEILVTVTIILVLAALTTMGTQKLRASADTTTTLRRITGLAQANALYATDHGGSYVPLYSWDEEGVPGTPWHFNPAFLGTLIGEIPSTVKPEEYEGYDGLPEQVLDPTVVRAKKDKWSRISASFGYIEDPNMPGYGWGQPGASAAHTLTSVKNPSEAFAFITATDWLAKYSGRYLWKGDKAVEGKTGDSKIAYRHQGKAVAAFYDGHAETISIKDMQRFDRNGRDKNVFWGGTQRGGK